MFDHEKMTNKCHCGKTSPAKIGVMEGEDNGADGKSYISTCTKCGYIQWQPTSWLRNVA